MLGPGSARRVKTTKKELNDSASLLGRSSDPLWQNNQKGKNDSPTVNLIGTAYISSANCHLASYAAGHS
jgi:hypothetical protein